MGDLLTNIRIKDEKVLITPQALKDKYPLSRDVQERIATYRRDISNIVHGKDPRFLIVCGPCSIHDTDAAIEYGRKLKEISERYKDRIYTVMRVYFEKPRTTVGWKGLINDPDMDNSFDLEKGLHIARELLLNLTMLGLPLASEALDPNSPQYLGDLFSWSAIGARTTESQTHREMASGLSVPVGFKNGTDGDLMMAINAIKSSSMPHRFMGINKDGQVCLLQTAGNPDGHIILRGGRTPNYSKDDIKRCEDAMIKANLKPSIMVDCSHGNSNKDYKLQPVVAEAVMKQIEKGNKSIMGLMIESNINEGSQSSDTDKDKLKYGVSITDACIGIEETDRLFHTIDSSLKLK